MEREPDQDTDPQEFSPGLHDMGGNIGPASIRGSAATGTAPGDDAAPSSGYSEPMGYMAGRDDDWPETAGSDEKAVGARTDEVAGDQDTFGPSPQATPRHTGGHPVEPGHPEFRLQGPVDEAHHGEIDDPDPTPDDADARSGVTGSLVDSDLSDRDFSDRDGGGDDPDGGSGRTWH